MVEQGLPHLIGADPIVGQDWPPKMRHRYKRVLIRETAYHSLLTQTRKSVQRPERSPPSSRYDSYHDRLKQGFEDRPKGVYPLQTGNRASLAYRRRATIGQFTIIPDDPYSLPPGPVTNPASTCSKMSNSPRSRLRIPRSIDSCVHSPMFTSHSGL